MEEEAPHHLFTHLHHLLLYCWMGLHHCCRSCPSNSGSRLLAFCSLIFSSEFPANRLWWRLSMWCILWIKNKPNVFKKICLIISPSIMPLSTALSPGSEDFSVQTTYHRPGADTWLCERWRAAGSGLQQTAHMPFFKNILGASGDGNMRDSMPGEYWKI